MKVLFVPAKKFYCIYEFFKFASIKANNLPFPGEGYFPYGLYIHVPPDSLQIAFGEKKAMEVLFSTLIEEIECSNNCLTVETRRKMSIFNQESICKYKNSLILLFYIRSCYILTALTSLKLLHIMKFFLLPFFLIWLGATSCTNKPTICYVNPNKLLQGCLVRLFVDRNKARAPLGFSGGAFCLLMDLVGG